MVPSSWRIVLWSCQFRSIVRAIAGEGYQLFKVKAKKEAVAS